MHAGSPDGRLIAYIGHRQGEAQGVNSDVWLVDVASGEERNLTEQLDLPMGQWVRSDPPGMFLPPDLAWSPDGSAIHVVYAEGGTSRAARVGLDGSVRTILAGDVGWFGFDIAASAGTIAALGATAEDPGELVIARADGSDARIATAVATAWRSTIQFGRLQRFEFDAPDGARLMHACVCFVSRPRLAERRRGG